MSVPPVIGSQESPAEELAGLRRQLVEMLAMNEDRDDPGSLLADLGNAHPVPSRLAKRSDEAMSNEQGEDVGVRERPPHLEQSMTDEIGPSQLVGETESDGDVHQKVQSMPALVRELGSNLSRGG